MTEPKIIKRYANRKLYDTERSCYVTLDDIALMIKAGDEIRVIDNKSGDDLTSVTLAQIIFEAEKKKSFMPLGLLRELIRNGGEQISGFARDGVGKVKAGAQDIRGQAQSSVERVRERMERLRQDIEGRIKQGDGRLKVVADAQRTVEELQQGFEERLKGGVTVVTRELDELRQKLAEIEDRLSRTD